VVAGERLRCPRKVAGKHIVDTIDLDGYETRRNDMSWCHPTAPAWRCVLLLILIRRQAPTVQRIRLCGIVICSLLALGGKPVLQSIAWVGMIVTYSQEQGFAQAVADTFSGERPCSLCNAIAESDEDGAPTPSPRADQVRLEATASLPIDFERLLLVGTDAQPMPRLEPSDACTAWEREPPVPPPRRPSRSI
jgi:hypothetical protein